MEQASPEKITQASSAQDFKKKREERDAPKPLVLSSGLTVLVKRPSIRTLIAEGFVPDKLASRVINAADTQGKVNISAAADLKQMVELEKIVAKHALVQPEVVTGEDETADYTAGQIHINDLDDLDRSVIFDYVTLGVEANKNAASFRDEQ